MAIKLPPRTYLTLPELSTRWDCTENDLRDLIVRGDLKPSYIINHVAQKVRFRLDNDDSGPYWLYETIGTVEDDDGKPHPKLYDTDGAYYLLHPTVTSAFDCRFYLFSQDRDHVEGTEDTNICFRLTGGRVWPHGITLDMVFKNGMVTLSEVVRFEEQQMEPQPLDKPLQTRERNTLLSIIAVLCKEAKIDYTRSAKAAGYIQSTASLMGLSLGESTIEGHLKKVDDALASRMK